MNDPDGVVRLLVEIVRGTPSLPGAAWRGRHELSTRCPVVTLSATRSNGSAWSGPPRCAEAARPGPRARQPSCNSADGS